MLLQYIVKKSRLLFGFLFDLFFPISCLGCGADGEWLCGDCLEQRFFLDWSRVYLPYCPHVDELWHVADFNDGLVSRLIRTAKYHGVKDISILMGRFMVGVMATAPELGRWGNLVFVPVPLYPTRLRMRGFNQAELIAQEISCQFNSRVSKLLVKVKNTKPQAKLIGEERRRNLLGSMNMSEETMNFSETVILIDDVLTTGATFEEAAKTLKAAGVKRVIGLAFAHGV